MQAGAEFLCNQAGGSIFDLFGAGGGAMATELGGWAAAYGAGLAAICGAICAYDQSLPSGFLR